MKKTDARSVVAENLYKEIERLEDMIDIFGDDKTTRQRLIESRNNHQRQLNACIGVGRNYNMMELD